MIRLWRTKILFRGSTTARAARIRELAPHHLIAVDWIRALTVAAWRTTGWTAGERLWITIELVRAWLAWVPPRAEHIDREERRIAAAAVACVQPRHMTRMARTLRAARLRRRSARIPLEDPDDPALRFPLDDSPAQLPRMHVVELAGRDRVRALRLLRRGQAREAWRRFGWRAVI